MSGRELFHEIRRLPLWLRLPVVALAVAGWAIFFAVVAPQTTDALELWLGGLLLVGLGGTLVPWLLWTLRLEIRVTPGELRFVLWPLARRTVPIAEIASAEVAANYRPLREHLGWGLRWTPWGGTAYTVRGFTGARLTLVPGARRPRTFLLGSGRPAALVEALHAAGAGR